jgi:hypothetical protein
VTTRDEFKRVCPADNCEPKDVDTSVFSNVVQNDIVVCGNEKVKVKDSAPFVKSYTGDGVSVTAEIDYSTLSGWF